MVIRSPTNEDPDNNGRVTGPLNYLKKQNRDKKQKPEMSKHPNLISLAPSVSIRGPVS